MVAGDPLLLSYVTEMSKIVLVVIYCAALVFWREIYSPIDSGPASDNSSPIGGYYHRLFLHHVVPPKILFATQLWKLTSTHRIRGWQPTTLNQKSAHTAPPTRKTFKRFLYLPPLGTADRIIGPIFSVLSGDSGPPQVSCCHLRTEYFSGTWRCLPSQETGPVPGTSFLMIPGWQWRIDSDAFSTTLLCTLWCLGVPHSLTPGIWTYWTACTRGGGKGPCWVPKWCPPRDGARNQPAIGAAGLPPWASLHWEIKYAVKG